MSDTNPIHRAIEEAQRKINATLAELEHTTEGYVRGLDVIDLDARTISDDRPSLQRRVFIDLQPKPGTGWAT
ncbi:hypothetical protein QHH_24 [Halomonas phage QHHSV-1]|nr:hypothetical protein QHH_24 [Halomonas phage QHHSV-1]